MSGGQHRILVYGAGVIGSYYATLLAAAGEDVSLLARGRRLEQLRLRRDINVLDRVADSELFDFIFVAVRSNQMISALDALLAVGNIGWIIRLWTDRQWYYDGAVSEMGQSYAEGIRALQTTGHLVAVIALTAAVAFLRCGGN